MDQITTNIIEVVTEPASEPVSLDEIKLHLRLNNGTTEDTQLAILISAARQHFEFLTDGRVVLPTTFKQHLSQWEDPIRLLRGPVSSVTSVQYYDEDDALQTLTCSNDVTSNPAIVYAESYPNLSTTRARPITVTFVAGSATVPSDIKLAVLLLASHWYEHRSEVSELSLSEVPLGFQRIADKYRTGMKGY